MMYCPECGVGLEPKTKECPLCGFETSRIQPLSRDTRYRKEHEHGSDRLHVTGGSSAGSGLAGSGGTDDGSSPSRPGVELSTPADPASTGESFSSDRMTTDESSGLMRKRRKLAWEALSVVVSVLSIALAGINLLDTQRVDWALYPVFSLVFVWVVVSSSFLAAVQPVQGFIALFLAIPGFLACLDSIDGLMSWALPVALPITFIVQLAVAGIVLAARNVKRKGLNLLGYSLIACSIVCLGIETTLDVNKGGGINLRWSGITAITLIPVGVILVYMHVRIAKNSTLKKLFRF